MSDYNDSEYFSDKQHSPEFKAKENCQVLTPRK